MEENKVDDIIYDLEEASRAGDAETKPEETQEENAPRDNDGDGDSGAAVTMTDSHDADSNEEEEESSPRKQIERMVEEMGAETLLEIIRDNRNAAIGQILKEVEATRRTDIPSGNSARRPCGSIFDLAALA